MWKTATFSDDFHAGSEHFFRVSMGIPSLEVAHFWIDPKKNGAQH
jgi:hypothetical protein